MSKIYPEALYAHTCPVCHKAFSTGSTHPEDVIVCPHCQRPSTLRDLPTVTLHLRTMLPPCRAAGCSKPCLPGQHYCGTHCPNHTVTVYPHHSPEVRKLLDDKLDLHRIAREVGPVTLDKLVLRVAGDPLPNGEVFVDFAAREVPEPCPDTVRESHVLLDNVWDPITLTVYILK